MVGLSLVNRHSTFSFGRVRGQPRGLLWVDTVSPENGRTAVFNGRSDLVAAPVVDEDPTVAHLCFGVKWGAVEEVMLLLMLCFKCVRLCTVMTLSPRDQTQPQQARKNKLKDLLRERGILYAPGPQPPQRLPLGVWQNSKRGNIISTHHYHLTVSVDERCAG